MAHSNAGRPIKYIVGNVGIHTTNLLPDTNFHVHSFLSLRSELAANETPKRMNEKDYLTVLPLPHRCHEVNKIVGCSKGLST